MGLKNAEVVLEISRSKHAKDDRLDSLPPNHFCPGLTTSKLCN